MNLRQIEILLAAVVVAVVYAVYATTSAPGLGTVDSGELTTVAATLGIAHPTGYPLYSLLGRLWVMLLPVAPDRAMVLFSVVAGALTAGVLAAAACRLFIARAQLDFKLAAIAAGLLTLGWALTTVAWESVTFTEVYPASALFTAILVYLAVRIDEAPRELSHIPLLAAFYWGLAFGNHLTILWQFPLVLYIHLRGRSRSSLARVLPWSLALFALGASINLYLPLRSSLNPALDWGNPQTVQNIIRHLSAWQYRVWMFTGNLGTQLGKLIHYVAQLPPLWNWPFVVLCIAGVLSAVVRRQALPLAAFAAWFISTGYNLNYDIPDINTYEIVPFPEIFLLAIFGLLLISDWVAALRRRPVVRAVFFMMIGLVTTGWAWAANHSAVDASRVHFSSQFARELFRTVDSNSVVLQANWDIQSPAIYEQQVNNYRRDIALFDLNLLQRSWYFPSLRRDHAELCTPCEAAYERFLAAVKPFEASQPVDGARIESAFTGMVNCLIEQAHAQGRSVYIRDLAEVNHPGVAAREPRIPGAYFDLLTAADRPQPFLNFAAFDTTQSMRDPHVRVCLRESVASTIRRGSYLFSQGDTTGALTAARAVSDYAPGLTAVQTFRRQLGLPPLSSTP
jgi:hypothetical protein